MKKLFAENLAALLNECVTGCSVAAMPLNDTNDECDIIGTITIRDDIIATVNLDCTSEATLIESAEYLVNQHADTDWSLIVSDYETLHNYEILQHRTQHVLMWVQNWVRRICRALVAGTLQQRAVF